MNALANPGGGTAPPPDTPPVADPNVPKAKTPGQIFAERVTPGAPAAPPAAPAAAPTPAPAPAAAPPEGATTWDHLDGLPDPGVPPAQDLSTSAQPGPPVATPAPGEPGSAPPAPGTPEYNLGAMRKSYEDKVSTLTIQNQQLSQRLVQYDVTAAPEFQEKYDSPIVTVGQQIQAAVVHFQGTPDQANELLALPANERHAWVAEHLPAAANALTSYFGELDRAHIERATALQNLQAEAQTIQQQRQQQQQQLGTQQQQVVGGLAKQALATLETEGFIPFTRIAGNDKWNESVDGMARYGMNVAMGQDDALKVKSIMQGVAAPALMQALMMERAKVAELNKRLGIADQVVPGIGNGAPAPKNEDGTPRAMTPAEAWAKNQ